MAFKYILTVDVGTSSTKTSLWTEAGQLVAHASSSYSLHRAEPLWAEIDGDAWWKAVCETIRKVLTKSEVPPASVAGIGVDAVSWTLIPVDENVPVLDLQFEESHQGPHSQIHQTKVYSPVSGLRVFHTSPRCGLLSCDRPSKASCEKQEDQCDPTPEDDWLS